MVLSYVVTPDHLQWHNYGQHPLMTDSDGGIVSRQRLKDCLGQLPQVRDQLKWQVGDVVSMLEWMGVTYQISVHPSKSKSKPKPDPSHQCNINSDNV